MSIAYSHKKRGKMLTNSMTSLKKPFVTDSCDGKSHVVLKEITFTSRKEVFLSRSRSGLDEKTFHLSIIQLHDAGKGTASFAECTGLNRVIAVAREQFSREFSREHRARASVPQKLHDHLAGEGLHCLIGNEEKVVHILGFIGLDRFFEIGEAEPQHAAGLQHAAQFGQRAIQVWVRNFRKSMDADGVIEYVVGNWQPRANVSHDVDPRARTNVGIDPAIRCDRATAPVQTMNH